MQFKLPVAMPVEPIWMLDSSVCAGAVRLQTPLLLPRNRKLYDSSELACFMDHSGMLVTLPYDLRVSSPSPISIHTHTLHVRSRLPNINYTQQFASARAISRSSSSSSGNEILLPQETLRA